MALNPEGGPTYVENYVDSPIIVNKTADEFYKQPMYYALGHFAKFIRPGSMRVQSTFTGQDLKYVVFERPDDSIVVSIFNPYVFSDLLLIINYLIVLMNISIFMIYFITEWILMSILPYQINKEEMILMLK